MKTYLDCFPCFLNQALRAARMAIDDQIKIKKVLDEVGMMLPTISLESTPPESGRRIYQKVHEITGNRDPYREVKRRSTKEALALRPFLKTLVENSDDKLLTAIRMAIAGNVIDFGPNQPFDMKKEIETSLSKKFGICDYDLFKNALNKSKKILYIGDNAGECVFDGILIETIKKPVIYVVRGAPIINDATLEDARQAGIDQMATLMSSGTDAPGTLLETCSDAFIRVYNDAELIISKGQGNYEALSDQDKTIFFLLKIKCRVIAEHMGLRMGSIVLKAANAPLQNKQHKEMQP